MSDLIEYDVVSHIFFCDGHVDQQLFLEALWDQWDTDFCTPGLDTKLIRHSYARFVRGTPGYWKEVAQQSRGTKPITVLNGSVVNLGPQCCPDCDALMALSTRATDMTTEEELWRCLNCSTELTIRRAR